MWRCSDTLRQDPITRRFGTDKIDIEFVASIGACKRPVYEESRANSQ